MDKLLAYLNTLAPGDREDYSKRCDTTVGYLRKACSVKQQLSEGLCMRLAGESQGAFRPEDLRPDLDWDYLRRVLHFAQQPTAQGVANG